MTLKAHVTIFWEIRWNTLWLLYEISPLVGKVYTIKVEWSTGHGHLLVALVTWASAKHCLTIKKTGFFFFNFQNYNQTMKKKNHTWNNDCWFTEEQAVKYTSPQLYRLLFQISHIAHWSDLDRRNNKSRYCKNVNVPQCVMTITNILCKYSQKGQLKVDLCDAELFFNVIWKYDNQIKHKESTFFF